MLVWIEQQVATAAVAPPRLAVHSANPPAHERMKQAINAIEARARSTQ